MDDSVKFLSQIYDLLVEGNVFETRSNEQKSIVNFKHPTDMKVRNHNSFWLSWKMKKLSIFKQYITDYRPLKSFDLNSFYF